MGWLQSLKLHPRAPKPAVGHMYGGSAPRVVFGCANALAGARPATVRKHPQGHGGLGARPSRGRAYACARGKGKCRRRERPVAWITEIDKPLMA